MSAVDVEATVARLEEIVQQQAAALAALQQNQVDPVLLAQQRRGFEGALDAPPRSIPEGARPGDFRPKHLQVRDKALAKMARVAINHGGVWSQDQRIPKIYGHKGFDPGPPEREACPNFGTDEFSKDCQRTCWTPEQETRFLYALGLKDLASNAPVPLTPPDPKNNRDALLELVGLLKGNQATTQDTYGRYPTREETADVSGDTRRKVRAA